MTWHAVFSLLDGKKLLFRYDPERNLIEFTHRKGKAEIVDLAHYHDRRARPPRRRR